MFGATLGRTAGKTMPPAYRCQGKEIRLDPNRQTYHCHGGFKGFDKQIYEVKQESAASITMCRMSPDGEGGYPGNLQVKIRFSLEHRALCIGYMAKSDRDTVVSISNHLYFNLNGQGNGDVLGHTVRIPSGRVLHIDGQGVSDGGIRQTAGTPFDFTRPCRIGEQMAKEDEQLKFAGGFDHTYLREVSAAEPVLEAWGTVRTSGCGYIRICLPFSFMWQILKEPASWARAAAPIAAGTASVWNRCSRQMP